MDKLPKITRTKEIARTRLFKVEELDLIFSNDEKRTYERLVAGRNGAVMIVPIINGDSFIFIREYSAGTENYQLAFPKGLMEEGESINEAANRELQEEVGYRAEQFTTMKKMSLAPGYLTHKMNLVMAEGLSLSKLDGDEPEPLEVIKLAISEIDNIVARKDFTEARSIAAMYLAKHILDERKQ